MAKSSSSCRLCLAEIQNGNVTLLDGIIKDMLEIILPELNFTICNPSSICHSCLETLKQSYNFKSMCLEVEDKVQDVVDPKKLSCVDLKEVIKKNKDIKPNSVANNMIVCRICLNVGDESGNTKLCSYEGDPLQNMVEKCLPEMDLTLSQDPFICQICLEQLEEQFHFIMQCLDTEAKINFYSVKKSIFKNIDLSKVHAFSTCMEETELEATDLEPVFEEKKETPGLRMRLSVIQEKVIDLANDNQEEFGTNLLFAPPKEEVSFALKKDENGEDVITSRTTVLESDGNDSDVSVTCKNDIVLKNVVPKRRKSSNAKGPSKPKTEYTYKEDPGDESEEDYKKKRGRMRRCKICNFKTNFNSRMKAHMTRNHSAKIAAVPVEPPKVEPKQEKSHKCRTCTFQCAELHEYNQHKKVHQKEREKHCPHCDQTFIRPDFLRKHLDACYLKKFPNKRPLTPPVEESPKKKAKIQSPNVTMSKPNTRNIISIHGKMLKMFKCQLCPYQTRMKGNRDRHALTHKKSSEMKVHKCKICQFETIQKENYLTHMQGHEIDSEKVMRCFLCSYQPSSKESLSLHVAKVHKSGTG